MMECAKVKKMLPDYSVGALSKRKRDIIKRHIENCPDCLQELRQLDNVGLLLDAIPQEEPPAFIWKGIKSEIEKQSTTKASSLQRVAGWLWKERIPAFAVSLGILIVTTGLYFFVWKSSMEPKYSFNAKTESEQQLLSNWNNPFADRVALGMLVMKSKLGDKKNEESY